MSRKEIAYNITVVVSSVVASGLVAYYLFVPVILWVMG